MDIFLQIETNQNKYTPTEKKVKQFIESNKTTMINQSITEIARNIGVSEAAITRFSQKAGFKGFNELKFLLAQEQLKQSNNAQNILDRLHEDYKILLENTISLSDPEQIKLIKNQLLQAKRIKLYGIASSGLVAEELAHRLYKLGLPVFAFREGHYMKMDGAVSTPTHIAIGVSLSGVTLDVVEALKAAKENGAYTIAVTNFIDSPLSKIADTSIHIPSKNFLSTGAMISPQLGVLFVFDYILTELFYENPDRNAEVSQKIIHTIFRTDEYK